MIKSAEHTPNLTEGNNMKLDFKFQFKSTVKVIKKDSPNDGAIGVVTARAQYITKGDEYFVEFKNEEFACWLPEATLELVMLL